MLFVHYCKRNYPRICLTTAPGLSDQKRKSFSSPRVRNLNFQRRRSVRIVFIYSFSPLPLKDLFVLDHLNCRLPQQQKRLLMKRSFSGNVSQSGNYYSARKFSNRTALIKFSCKFIAFNELWLFLQKNMGSDEILNRILNKEKKLDRWIQTSSEEVRQFIFHFDPFDNPPFFMASWRVCDNWFLFARSFTGRHIKLFFLRYRKAVNMH